MSRGCHDNVLDAALNYIKNNADRMTVCSALPTTYTQAITTYKLADVNISSANYTGPSDGNTSGRKLVVNAQASVAVDTVGTAVYLALVDTSNEELVYWVPKVAEDITDYSYIDIPAWEIEFRDPTRTAT